MEEVKKAGDVLRNMADSFRGITPVVHKEAPADLLPPEEAELTPDQRRQKAFYATWKKTIPTLYKGCSLDDFNRQGELVQHVLKGGSVLFLGTQGVGKTRFGWAYLDELMRTGGKRCLLTKAIDLMSRIKSRMSQPGDLVSWMLEEYGSNYDVLIVDEIDKIMGTQTDFSYLSRLIDYRYEWSLQTIVMGNSTEQDFKHAFGMATWSRLTGPKDGGRFFTGVGKDRREQQ